MALVRISFQLLNDVRNNIDSFGAKICAQNVNPLCPAAANSEVKGGEFADFCEGKVWGEFLHLKDQMPSKWCTESGLMYAYLKDENNSTVIKLDIRPAKGNFKFPPGTSTWSGPTTNIKVSECNLQWVHDFLAQKKVYDAALTAHNDKFNTIRNQVVGFLENSKSLNDAIKRYPDIKLWVPQEYLTRVEEVVERKPREVREKEVVEKTMTTLDHTLLASMGVMKTISDAA